MKTIETIKRELNASGFSTLAPGVELWTKEDLIADQATWSEEDDSKEADFSGSPFWLVLDSGDGPFAIASIEQVINVVGAEKF